MSGGRFGFRLPVAVPGRRQLRLRDRPPARRVRRTALRPERIAWFSILALIGSAVAVRQVGRWARAISPPPEGRPRPPPGACRAGGVTAIGIPRPAGLLEICLSTEPDELLHLLPDRAVPGSACGPRSSPAVPCSSARWRSAPMPAGRSATKIGRKAVIWVSILRGPALHPDPAACQPVLDRGSERDHRHGDRLRLLSDPRLCPDPGAPGMSARSRPVLRLRLRRRRDRRGAARHAGRPDQHPLRLQICAFLPLIGLLTVFLPDERRLPGRA